MIGIALLVAVFICVSSIFFPELRRLAASILATGAVVVFGFWLLIEIYSK